MLEEWILKKIEIEKSKDNLKGADLCNAKLMQAQLKGACLEDADLTAAYLIKADLSEANLVGADLTQAVLSEADLSGADLEDAELTDTFLNGANLKGVQNLTCDQIDLANYDQETIFPDYITIKWSPDGYCECIEEE
ncbi:MAG: pentapeptide repeat-containing protein [Nitrospinota bacterium]